MGNVTAGAAANCKDSLDTQCNKRRKPQDQFRNILSLMGGFGIARAFRWRFKMPVLFCFRWFNFSVFFRSIKGWELPASTLDIGEQMVEDSNWRVRGIQPLATRWSRNSDHNCVFFLLIFNRRMRRSHVEYYLFLLQLKAVFLNLVYFARRALSSQPTPHQEKENKIKHDMYYF